MNKRILPYILIAVSLTSCLNADLAPYGDDLLPPKLTISEPQGSDSSIEVTFEAKLSQSIIKEECGFYFSYDLDFANSEKVGADKVTKDKGTFSYSIRITDFGSRWYCKAYASNGKTEILSPVTTYQVRPFSTYVSAGVPEVISSIEARAELSFTVSAVEGVSLTECGVCYGETPALSIESSHVASGRTTGKHTVAIKGLTVGKGYYVCSYARKGENIVYSKAVSLTTRSGVPEAVDLGLSVKWASFNVGATKPEEYGGYYQWAGLEDVANTSIYLDYNNCPYHTGSDDNTGWTKYVPSDNKTVLDPSDDVAHVKLGGKWRMPTDAEWTELRENCTWTWTTQNGVNGYKVTSKKSGYTSKSIFLPAAGCRYYDYLSSVGSYGNYWSSSLYTGNPDDAYRVYFNSDNVYRSYYNRYNGLSVRPVSGDRVCATGVSLNKTSLSLNIGETFSLGATVTPSNAAEQSVNWSSDNELVATVDYNGKVTAVKAGSATITVTTTDGGYIATCTVTVSELTPEAVDLGLSVKWASFNIGATNPEEHGGYYQWAGLEDVTNTSIYLHWDNCPYHTGSNLETGWTKYVPSDKSSYWSGSGSPDNKTVLDPSDDVAHVKLGGKWRMPTDAEWTELRENCTWTWTTQNGVNGYKVTSKKSGYTSKFIFLPAAGRRGGNSLYGAGYDGYCWSSSLYGGSVFLANNLFFCQDGFYYGGYNRGEFGSSIRPVYGDRVNVTGVSLNKSSLSLNIGETFSLGATVTPSNAAEQSVNWSSDNELVATVDYNGKVTAVKAGSATITVTTTDGGYIATCTVTVSEPTPEAVDLGLSVKWASFNIGATKPEEYGGYYQWAGLEDVANTSIYLDYNNCPYHTGPDCNTGWTKYVPSDKSSYWSGSGSPDNKSVLDPEDDVAHVKLGGKWRMPTEADWEELIENCTWTWTTQNGVNGYKVTSKKSGYTSKSIFLPAAGFRYLHSLGYVGSDGRYCSSSLGTDLPLSAYALYFDSGTVETDHGSRYHGGSVRPVSE